MPIPAETFSKIFFRQNRFLFAAIVSGVLPKKACQGAAIVRKNRQISGCGFRY
jgi:hypothetical protein